MEITLLEVKQKFLDVLRGSLSREDADSWANFIMQKHELRELNFSPSSDKAKIWAGIKYLNGIDLRIAPSVYLHSEEDIKNAFEKKFGDKLSPEEFS